MVATWLIFPVLSSTCCSALVAKVICATLPETRCAQRGTGGRTAQYRKTRTLMNAEAASTALRSTKNNKNSKQPATGRPYIREEKNFWPALLGIFYGESPVVIRIFPKDLSPVRSSGEAPFTRGIKRSFKLRFQTGYGAGDRTSHVDRKNTQWLPPARKGWSASGVLPPMQMLQQLLPPRA